MTEEQAVLQAILQSISRLAFPVENLQKIVSRTGAAKQIQAYNLCDGTKNQAEIAKELSLDAGNFSRTVNRWVSAGVVFKLGEGKDVKLLHAYPLPSE